MTAQLRNVSASKLLELPFSVKANVRQENVMPKLKQAALEGLHGMNTAVMLDGGAHA